MSNFAKLLTAYAGFQVLDKSMTAARRNKAVGQDISRFNTPEKRAWAQQALDNLYATHARVQLVCPWALPTDGDEMASVVFEVAYFFARNSDKNWTVENTPNEELEKIIAVYYSKDIPVVSPTHHLDEFEAREARNEKSARWIAAFVMGFGFLVCLVLYSLAKSM